MADAAPKAEVKAEPQAAAEPKKSDGSAAGAAPKAEAKKPPKLWQPAHVLDLVTLERSRDTAAAKQSGGVVKPGGKTAKSFEYAATAPFNAEAVLAQSPPLCTVVVPAEQLSAANPAFKSSRLWGTDVYSADSDVVCVLAHQGYLDIDTEAPAQAKEVVVTLRVTHPLTAYAPSTRCGIRSRRRGGGIGPGPHYSYLVESCVLKMDSDLKDRDLFPTPHVFQQPLRVARPRQQGSARYCLPGLTVVFDLSMDPCLKYSLPMVLDTYQAPEEEEDDEDKPKPKASKTKSKAKGGKKASSTDEDDDSKEDSDGAQAMQTESSAESAGDADANGAAAAEPKPESADAGGSEAPAKTPPVTRVVIEASRLTSARLVKECIYMETSTDRYQLTQDDAGGDGKRLTYTLSRVLHPQLLDQAALSAQSIPLGPSLVEVVHDSLKWREVKWGPSGVSIRGRAFELTCLRFVPRTADVTSDDVAGIVRSLSSGEAGARASKQKRRGTSTVGPQIAKKGKKAQEDGSNDDEEKPGKGKGKAKPKAKGKAKAADEADEEPEDGDEAEDDEAAAPAQRSSRRTKGKAQENPKAEKRGSARAAKRTRTSAKEAEEEAQKEEAQTGRTTRKRQRP